MAEDVTMPRLSDSMEEGTILKWLVSEGDEVERGQEIVEIETDKANMTYESDTAGTLIEIVASEGDTIELGGVIARIGEAGEESGKQKAESAESEEEEDSAEEAEDEEPDAEEEDAEEGDAEEEPSEEREHATASSNGSDGGERVKASPVARRMANELGVDIADVQGSGPGGRILKADVQAASESDGGGKPEEDGKQAAEADSDGKPAKADKKKQKKEKDKGKKKDKPKDEGDEEKPADAKPKEPVAGGDAGNRGELQVQELTRLQRTVSRRMAESKATAPDFALEVEIDMSLCVELRERLKQVEEKPPSFNDMVVKACANALRDHPRVNAAYRDGKFELYSRVNVGVAVAANDALVVPTVFDADKKSLGEISRTVRDLAGKVRDGKITPPDLSGGTFTVSNLGMYGVDSFTAVINPPQAALLAVGALKKKPIVDENGRIVARDMMNATLVSDHRILYGADAAQFLARVRELLEQPLSLAL
jgi:pyruvate dehydrogenase E2 component (dihydrolipoamide acetyltransferase)